ncbi:peptidyl-prolyl cis-trans isomerase A [Escherichia coli]|uniref:Peptidyl-prolyl cis-trans isomerase A n=1 Tax=Escherichia coli TaxID=562 RepID=A0A376TWL1_ECOLX|nr:peptidyl-prolyl cis-trans isomerase A [Escherichia coli]
MFKSTLAAMAAVFALSALSPAAMAAKGDPHVLLTTSAGNIELELDKQKRQCLCKLCRLCEQRFL